MNILIREFDGADHLAFTARLIYDFVFAQCKKLFFSC